MAAEALLALYYSRKNLPKRHKLLRNTCENMDVQLWKQQGKCCEYNQYKKNQYSKCYDSESCIIFIIPQIPLLTLMKKTDLWYESF